MITPRGTLRLLGATTFLLLGGVFPASDARAVENRLRQQQLEESRVPLEHAQVRRRHVDADASAVGTQPRSMVAKAAHGEVIESLPSGGLPESQHRGSGVRLRQVGYLNTCGPVCDCGHCDPGCGIEPVCGTDVFVDEPVCGVEVGCGIGAMVNSVGPSCGIDGCTDCCEAVCGIDAPYAGGPVCGIESVGDCACDACSNACEVDCIPFMLPMFRVNWREFQFFYGHQGFKGPLNFANTSATNANQVSGSGSFGFQQGFNRGRCLRQSWRTDLSSQFGLRATQSNLSGAEFTTDRRYQIFLTWGLFRRVDYGMQYGLVLDYLSDDWYYQADLLQLRGEVSWRAQQCNVYGFQFMAPLRDDSSLTLVRDPSGTIISDVISMESTDQYRFFYRRELPNAGNVDGFLGWTGDGDGVFGSILNLPLRRNVVLQTGSTYLVPSEGRGNGGNREEGWNVSIALIYRPGGPNGSGRYGRPLFDVADNGTMMVDVQ